MRVVTLSTPRGDFGARLTEPDHGSAWRTPVVCLHGFPDDASTFDRTADLLAAEGHPVSSVYLRGYAPSPTTGSFTIQELAEDVVAVAHAVGHGEPVHFIGHDYGAQIGYAALARHPDRFTTAVLLAGAHPGSIARNTWRHPRQLWMSRYIVFFQFGEVADRRVARDDFAALDRLWNRWSPGGIGAEHRSRVKETIATSMPAPIAMYREGGFSVGADPIAVPTLFITGDDDGCSLPAMSDGQETHFSGDYERQIWSGIGHFPQLEDPERTARASLAWFSRHDTGRERAPGSVRHDKGTDEG